MSIEPEEKQPRSARALRGFLGILAGSGAAQLLIIAAVPVLSRLYDPSETAHYMLLISAAAIIGSIASLKLELAIPIPAHLKESRSLFWLAALAPLFVLPVVWVIVGLVAISGLWTATPLNMWDVLGISAFVMISGIFTAGGQVAVRTRSYGVLSRIPLIQMIGTLATQISLGGLNNSRGLFIGSLLGRCLWITALVRAGRLRLDQIPSPQDSTALLKRYWRFPLLFAPASLVEVAGANLPSLMLPALFGFGPAGLFAMAMRVVGVPVAVIGAAAGQVFLGEFARTTSRSESLRAFWRWSAGLLAMGLTVACGAWLLSPLVLPWFLGSGWTGTAELAQYLGVMAGAAIVGSPVQHVWTVRQRGLMQFTWNLIRLCSTAGVIWYGAQIGSSIETVAAALATLTTAVYALAWLGCLWAAARPGARTSLDPVVN